MQNTVRKKNTNILGNSVIQLYFVLLLNVDQFVNNELIG